MSQFTFNLSVKLNGDHKLEKWLVALNKYYRSIEEREKRSALAVLESEGQKLGFIDHLKPIGMSVGVESDGGQFLLDVEASMATPIEYFFSLMNTIDALGAEEYRARFFDSSSGGTQVWRKPDFDIEFEDKHVFLLGDVESDVAESVEAEGAEIVDELSDKVDIVIVSEDCLDADKEVLRDFKGIVIDEDESWDFFEPAI